MDKKDHLVEIRYCCPVVSSLLEVLTPPFMRCAAHGTAIYFLICLLTLTYFLLFNVLRTKCNEKAVGFESKNH